MGGTAALIVKRQKNNVDIKHKYVSEKKNKKTLLFPVTSPNVDRFSKFFHGRSQH